MTTREQRLGFEPSALEARADGRKRNCKREDPHPPSGCSGTPRGGIGKPRDGIVHSACPVDRNRTDSRMHDSPGSSMRGRRPIHNRGAHERGTSPVPKADPASPWPFESLWCMNCAEFPHRRRVLPLHSICRVSCFQLSRAPSVIHLAVLHCNWFCWAPRARTCRDRAQLLSLECAGGIGCTTARVGRAQLVRAAKSLDLARDEQGTQAPAGRHGSSDTVVRDPGA